MSVEKLIEAAKKQRSQKNYTDALALAKSAVEQAPENADAWWQLSLCKYSLNDLPGAREDLETTVKLVPAFGYGWTLLGRTHWRLDEPDKAREALEHALALDPRDDEALEILADIHEEAQDDESQFKILEQLALIKDVPARFNNRLGILHYKRKNYLQAIHYYKREAALSEDPAPIFNLGLVYSASEISQDADAVDIWRLTTKRFPNFERSNTELARILPRALELSKSARGRGPVLRREQWFEHYINPYDLLNVPVDAEFSHIDAKTLQRHKRALLQEIELEDGEVSWLDGCHIEKSKAIAVADQVHDKRVSEYHWLVFKAQPLLRFLTRGEIEHFLVGAQHSPLDVLERLESDAGGFIEWLSGPFSRQFDLVLAEVVDQRDNQLLKCVLNGRRWVTSEDADRCFESARRRVDNLLQPLRNAAESALKHKPTVRAATVVQDQSIVALLNHFPFYFRDYQNEACSLLRSISIDCYNSHSDEALAEEFHETANAIRGKSADLAQRLADDAKRMHELGEEERKHEAKLVRGNEAWEITKAGARLGKSFIEADDVTAVRWGILVNRDGNSTSHEYLVVVSGSHSGSLSYSWRTSSELEKNAEHFGKLVGAVVEFLLPRIMTRLRRDFEAGLAIQIGQCAVDKVGVKITKRGWFSEKVHLVPWSRLDVKLENGMIVASDRNDRSIKVEMPLRTTDNATVLRLMATND